jgi:DNA-binding NarL/FixJ family response regulator
MAVLSFAAWAPLAALAQAQGDGALAGALVRQGLPDGPRTAPGGCYFSGALALQRLAAARALADGDLPGARAWLEAHDRWLAWAGAVAGQAEAQLAWAAYHRAAGDPALAQQRATQALAQASEPRQPLALLAAHRLLGELATAAGRPADAAGHLDQALALAEDCAAPYERALIQLALAELRAAAGDHAAARALLEEARAVCAPLGAAPALARADALADALAARLAAGEAAPPAAGARRPGGLTAREVEILRLIAAGRSNRRIAEELSLSFRTVERHVANLYAKIDAANRADATAYAFRHHLV